MVQAIIRFLLIRMTNVHIVEVIIKRRPRRICSR